MKIKKLHIFAELGTEPGKMRQVEITDDNQNIILHFINSMEKGIRLSQDTIDYLGLNYYDKLRALLEGLEIENIEELLRNEDVKTYRLIGKIIALKIKEL